jgi:hypothetical protein
MHLPKQISRNWLLDDLEGIIEPTEYNLKIMQKFCMDMWKKRAEERQVEVPKDLTNSCKFTSIFLRHFIGGEIGANECHQFVIKDNDIFDLNKDACDVLNMKEPYFQDYEFIGNPEHIESIETCIPRIEKWIEVFHQHYFPYLENNHSAFNPKI